MIWPVLISAFIAFGMLITMYDEISTGFYRARDYVVTTALLYAAGALLFFGAGLIPATAGAPYVLFVVLKAFIGFGLMIVVWGGTLTLGSLIIRLVCHKKPA